MGLLSEISGISGLFGLVDNDVTLQIGGTPFSGWETVSVSKQLESIAGSFQVQLFDKWSGFAESFGIKNGDPCTVLIGSDVVIVGYIDGIDISFDGDSHTFTVKGRDKAGDLVDCSIITKTSQYKNKTLTELATEFCSPFGISVTAETDVGKPFPKWDVQQGESVFENLDRAAKLRGVLFVSDNTGNLKIVKSGQDRAADAIIQGENLLAGSSTYDDTNRFSQYVCKGQSAGTDKTNKEQSAHNKDEATDSGVTRYRPLLVVAEGSSDKKTTQKRAQWEATVRAANAFKFSATVQGWRQSSGELWKPNQRVMATASLGGASGDFLISNVTYEKNGSTGTTTVLELVRPDAFLPQPDLKDAKK